MNIPQRIVIGLGVIALALVVFVWPVKYTASYNAPGWHGTTITKTEKRVSIPATATRGITIIVLTVGIALLLKSQPTN